MLEDLPEQRELYRPGPYWQGYARRIAQAIREEGLARFRSSPRIGRGYADVFADAPFSSADPGWRSSLFEASRAVPGGRALVAAIERRIARRNREAHAAKQRRLVEALDGWFSGFAAQHALPDTCVGEPQRRIPFAAGEIGELYLRAFAWISECSRQVDLGRVQTVLEIGGGFGAMAHALLHLLPNIRTYVYLDIPPLLYVGTQYLKRFHGERVVDYLATRALERIDLAPAATRRIFAICPWQLERITGTIDFCWNSSSFQEMPAAVVAYYASQIGRLLAADGRVGFYVYLGGGARTTLRPEAIIGALRAHAGLDIERIEAPIADRIVPGALYLGRRSGAPR